MDFNQAEEKFRGLKARFEAGDLSEADFKAQLEDLMVEDETGGWWMLGYETERWYHHDGTSWVQQDPPGRSAPTPAAASTPVEETIPAAAPPVEPAQAQGTHAAAAAPVAQQRAASASPASPAKRKSPMLFVGIGAAVLLLCVVAGLFLFRPTPPSSPATEAPVATAPDATEAPVSAEPTSPSEPTAQPTEPPTEAPTAAPAADQRFFTEEFDNGSSSWEPFVTSGKLDELNLTAASGSLAFDLTKRQLWAYALYTPETYQDVRIEAQVENLGGNQNNITLFCRYDQDLGWYELSIANSGLYWIYRGKWDSNGVTASYAVVVDGGSNNIKQGKAINTYAMECTGNTISAFINDKLIKSATDDQLKSGQVGIGVSSFQSLPIAVNYDWVKISEP